MKREGRDKRQGRGIDRPLWFRMSAVGSVNGRQEWSGKTEGGKTAGMFFLEQISMSQIYSGQELESFPLPRRTGFISLSQTSMWVAANSL